ncbi:hypothetical protein CBR_g23684 [Chara braunii]|uniref:Uncharacterized protein n=1 Tax=Chara braunii TaxID=69332 RepID=A0A388L532_CHABU|nr:hypothetical protein CBR_g23684 [Chara braunii]|eukprot:GBG77352.1 hypothetical protein CBR_g23684 [Chara braunii]
MARIVCWIEEEHRAVWPDDDSAAPGVNIEVLAMAFMGRRLQFQPAPQNHEPGTDPNIRAFILYRPGHFSALTFADSSWTLWDNGGRVHTVGNINCFYQQNAGGSLSLAQEQYVDEHLQALHPPENNPADSTTNSERTSPQEDGCALPLCRRTGQPLLGASVGLFVVLVLLAGYAFLVLCSPVRVVYSPRVLPVFVYNAAADKVVDVSGSFLILCLVALAVTVWGLVATVKNDTPFLGVAVSTITLVLTFAFFVSRPGITRKIRNRQGSSLRNRVAVDMPTPLFKMNETGRHSRVRGA